MIYSLVGKRVWVAGHKGLVGSAIVDRLQNEGCEILTVSRQELDLLEQRSVREWMKQERPDAIFLAAARVGGIFANANRPADFIYENLMIEANVIEAAFRNNVGKLLFLGSSCIYPRLAKQPIVEDSLLTGPLEKTNEAYAVAKIAGIKLCSAYREQHGCDFISAMPTNLYGPRDNFDLTTSHVLPALIRKAHEAKLADAAQLSIWGSGTPKREFLHVDDCADALVFLMQYYSAADHVNVGCGQDIAILDLARLVSDVVGFAGDIVTDTSKPDGTPSKLMSIDRISALGWQPKISLRVGIQETYSWYRDRHAQSV